MNSRLELSNYIDKKYGSIYTKSGNGKSQVGGTKVTDFAKKILGNRVLDVYLKYTALKTLTSATMVPVAFILGKEYLQKVMNQSGGGDPIPSNLPLLDHPLVGTYLKVLGLSALDLTTGTLLPLGALMIMHDLYTSNSSQAGGAINNKQTAKFNRYIEKRYGKIYSKNGRGKSQVGGTRVANFAKKILGNRVLDVYLKYTAVKTLTSATMVPVAFILGKEYLQKVMNQSGGGDPIPSNIPLLDHPLVGTYLKVLGLSALDLTTGTLLPLGSLMIIHDLYTSSDSQTGGSKAQEKNLSRFITEKYGSIVSKNGRGKAQVGGTRVTDFAKKILGNRVLDVYLKYTAVKTLTSATMVPVAFILGKEYLEKVMNQSGGGDPIPADIPLLDHPLVGTYLKILGLSALDLTTGTLLPLGSLMIIHDLYTNSGSQTGGARNFVGSSVPPNIVQQVGSVARGQGLAENTISNRFPNHNNQMQLACNTGNCSPNVFTSYKDVTPQRVHVDAFPSQGIKNSYSRAIWSGDLGIYNRAVTPVSMAGGGSNYQYITNPNNGKVYNINSKEGKGVLNNYLKTLK